MERAMRVLDIAGGVPVAEYASQGNAVLGIRGSGKSYTATWTAEQLHAAGVPFVAFDPIGMWHWLRVPDHGPAVPVLIAGGKYADIPLTPEDAPDIIRAVMELSLSVVFDLYSIDLSKADWRRIVESSTRTLLYENEPHGIRHLFLEEAAEFIPQKVGGEHAKVYAEWEKVARMGGNARLGYTLINQRAEEVSKAVLELADCLVLHRQKGKNSLMNLAKWLDVADLSTGRAIIKTLPGLPAGDCWVWSNGAEAPVRFHVPQKNTHHPDRKRTGDALPMKPRLDMRAEAAAVMALVPKLRQRAMDRDPEHLRKRIAELEARPAGGGGFTSEHVQRAVEGAAKQAQEEGYRLGWDAGLDEATSLLKNVTRTRLLPAPAAPAPTREQPRLVIVNNAVPAQRASPAAAQATPENTQGLKLAARRILQCLAQYPGGRSRAQLAIITGYSSTGGGFKNALSDLRTRELITSPHEGFFVLTPSGRALIGDRYERLPTGKKLLEQWLGEVKQCERAVLGVLFDSYPRTMDRADVARLTGYVASAGGFKNALGRLRTLELITGAPSALSITPAIFGD
jgi:uncharacterized protein